MATYIYAHDILLSLANKLPRNLLIEDNELEISFLLRLDKTQLKKLRLVAQQKDNHKPLFLSFYSNKGTTPPTPCYIDKIEWSKVKEIDFIGCDETPDEHQDIEVILMMNT